LEESEIHKGESVALQANCLKGTCHSQTKQFGCGGFLNEMVTNNNRADVGSALLCAVKAEQLLF
jgi:hypothetical protein